MQKIQTLTGHSFRVLYLGMSPDGESIVTGAGDETLRFWQMFPRDGANKLSRRSELVPSLMDIR
jgi:cell division cycle 20-like protein 1 (cofactor of APC complex)